MHTVTEHLQFLEKKNNKKRKGEKKSCNLYRFLISSMDSSSSSSLSDKNVMKVEGPIIIGGGPSGLAVAACLKKNGGPSPLILERSDCIASLWQRRTYDRLKLHLPKKFCQLPFLEFPESFPKYPTKYQFISYLESYVNHFSIQPVFNSAVVSADYDAETGEWFVKTGDDRFYVSKWVIAATGENAEPVVPEIQGLEKFEGKIIHSSFYRSGSEFHNQNVLVVGCGNSGLEVSLDLCRFNAAPHMVVRNTVHILPREVFGVSTFEMAMGLMKYMPVKLVDKFLLLATKATLGKTDNYGLRRPKTGPMEHKAATGKTPVLDFGGFSLIKSGKIKVMGEIREITKNGAKFIDGQEGKFDSIILATGFRSNVPNWLKGYEEYFTEEGMPKTPYPNAWKGKNGLFAVGYTRRGLLGMSSDAVKVALEIADQWRNNNNNNNNISSNPSF